MPGHKLMLHRQWRAMHGADQSAANGGGIAKGRGDGVHTGRQMVFAHATSADARRMDVPAIDTKDVQFLRIDDQQGTRRLDGR